MSTFLGTGPKVVVRPPSLEPEAKEPELTLDLPVVQDADAIIADLEFFALCPNGSRVPLDAICSEVARDPAGAVLRTIKNRLVLVIEAVKSGRLYWHQAFYLSTGTSSSMGGTWLPFSGLMIETAWQDHKNERGKEKDSWFAKGEYSRPERRLTLGPRKSTPFHNEFSEVFGKVFLPEGGIVADRFGVPSFLYASYKLGGTHFETSVGTTKDLLDNSPLIRGPSPLQECFKDPTRFPISPVPLVNDYIERNEALPYYNLFRHLGVKPIGLSKLVVPLIKANSINNTGSRRGSKPLSYSVPSLARYEILNEYLKQLYIDSKVGGLTKKELLAKVQEQSIPAMVAYLKKEGETFLNSAPFTLRINAENVEFYGGRRKRTRKHSKRHKGTSRKHRL